MKTPSQTIKEAGLKTKKIKLSLMTYKNPITGRGTQQPLFLFNRNNEIFCIDGRPYCPIGGKLAFASLIEGDLNQPGFSFKEFTIESY